MGVFSKIIKAVDKKVLKSNPGSNDRVERMLNNPLFQKIAREAEDIKPDVILLTNYEDFRKDIVKEVLFVKCDVKSTAEKVDRSQFYKTVEEWLTKGYFKHSIRNRYSFIENGYQNLEELDAIAFHKALKQELGYYYDDYFFERDVSDEYSFQSGYTVTDYTKNNSAAPTITEHSVSVRPEYNTYRWYGKAKYYVLLRSDLDVLVRWQDAPEDQKQLKKW